MAPRNGWFLIIACKVSVFLINRCSSRRSRLILGLLLLSISGFILTAWWLFLYWILSVVSTGYPFKVLEGNHYYSHIVEWLAHQAILENALNAKSTVLMHADVLLCLFDLRSDLAGRGCALCLLSCFTCQPNGFSDIIISQLVVDSIRG